MKKVFLFGRVTRIFFLVCLAFLLYAFTDMCVQSGFAFKSILLLLLAVVLVVFGLFWIYFPGIWIDRKNGKVKLMLGLSANYIHERELAHIVSLDVEKEVVINGMSKCVELWNPERWAPIEDTGLDPDNLASAMEELGF